jgi:phosphoglucomutase
MSTIEQIAAAEQAGKLLASTAQNLRTWLAGTFMPDWARASIEELVAKQQWPELNDRFYRTLEFGTGGMRGRTIGKATAAAEIGVLSAQGSPEHPAVGCNVLNDFTVVRATVGLFRYTQQFLCTAGSFDLPRLVIAHDVRHFSRHFCELAASTWNRLGGQAFIFDGPRSTPQLSFTVRHIKASAGIVITASHNPPHDNGYKVYFGDGGQVVPPHDNGIIAKVEQVDWADVAQYFAKSLDGVVTLGVAVDTAYLDAASDAVINPEIFKGSKLKVVYTNIHGTGRVATLPLFERFGVKYATVEEQFAFDPRFPSVKSPNPENAAALALGVELANKTKADVIMATDPDCDRMGVAVRNAKGEMELLTGNQIGALLAEYRISAMKKLGVIPKKGSKRAALIKTFVTSQLQDAIGAAHGLKVVNTLTGFKLIGAKIARYEAEMKAKLFDVEGVALDYDATSPDIRAELLLEYSTLYVFGGEESYGYLPTDTVRDKDGNSACLIFCELAAAAKKSGKTIGETLDALYLKYGYYTEAIGNIYYEGAAGAAKIAKILASYRKSPPKAFGKVKVTKFRDFGREKIKDADGELIPSQDLYIVTLANGYNYAVRGSGTEPKIKFYLFGKAEVKSAKGLPEAKTSTKAALEELRQQIEADAAARAEG